MEQGSVLYTFIISTLICFVIRVLNLPPTLTFLSLSRVRGEEHATNLRTSAWERLLLNLPLLVGGMFFSVKLIKRKCTTNLRISRYSSHLLCLSLPKLCQNSIGNTAIRFEIKI